MEPNTVLKLRTFFYNEVKVIETIFDIGSGRKKLTWAREPLSSFSFTGKNNCFIGAVYVDPNMENVARYKVQKEFARYWSL